MVILQLHSTNKCQINVIPDPCRLFSKHIYNAGLIPRQSELPSRTFPKTLRTPEPGFSRDSPNSRTGLFPRLSELPNQTFPETIRTPEPGFSRDYPSSRTYDIISTPGFSRIYKQQSELRLSRDSINPTVLHTEVYHITYVSTQSLTTSLYNTTFTEHILFHNQHV